MKKLSFAFLSVGMILSSCGGGNDCSTVDFATATTKYSTAFTNDFNEDTPASCKALKAALTEYIAFLEDCPDLKATSSVTELKADLADLQKECP
jgi:hypothetical protein